MEFFMARPSKSELCALPLNPRVKPRLPVPATLTPAQAGIWKTTINSLPAEYFPAETAPLLERFCCHTARCRDIEVLLAAVDPAAPDGLARLSLLSRLARAETAAAGSMARALRLTTQSRLKAETASSRATTYAAKLDAKRPWDLHDDGLIPGLNEIAGAPFLK
jgi:hypothetical protein